MGTEAGITLPAGGTASDLRSNAILQAVLWVSLSIIVWRRLIVWTLGRAWLTALVSLIPFVQGVIWLPLWSSQGCISEDVLMVGQHSLGMGVWIWLAVWVWWGWERLSQPGGDVGLTGGVIMSGTSKRIVASLGSLPVVLGAFAILTVGVDDFIALSPPGEAAMEIATTSVLAAGIWVAIWRRQVAWTRRVAMRTAGFTLLLIGALSATWFTAVSTGLGGTIAAVCWTLPLEVWGLWMALTVRLWPMKVVDLIPADVPPRCLKCGYMLVGLYATRCPECGDERTIDELWCARAVPSP
ncbi:MAG: hypothetical protein HY763_07795 [Planctomycetes bacterium]|nr:hypothetical protein [Planctomycetota bacterium]